ncbi:MAG: hypothetical protein FP824_07220 [Euryarchaeota archaeon]|nr:hypothetical protein [Euryarchaeota archaeon]
MKHFKISTETLYNLLLELIMESKEDTRPTTILQNNVIQFENEHCEVCNFWNDSRCVIKMEHREKYCGKHPDEYKLKYGG